MDEVRAHIAGRVTEDALSEHVGKGATLRKRWDALPIDHKRTILRAVIQAVTIAPTTKAANRLDPDRIGIDWRAYLPVPPSVRAGMRQRAGDLRNLTAVQSTRSPHGRSPCLVWPPRSFDSPLLSFLSA